MSSGPYLRSRYSLDNGEIANVRVQPETVALSLGGSTNAAPTGAITVPGSAVVSRGKRAKGINTRTVSIVFTPPLEGYAPNASIRLPWLNPTSFGSLNVGATGSYLSAPVTLVGKSPETVR